MESKVPSFFRFEDLRVYGKAVEYGKWIVSVLKDGRSEAEKNLGRTFINSAIDIAINIAEGSSRSKSQFDHYLKVSKSAIRECIIFTEVAKGLGLLTDEESEKSRELLMEQTRMIGALIISLQRGGRRPQEYSDVDAEGDDLGDVEETKDSSTEYKASDYDF